MNVFRSWQMFHNFLSKSLQNNNNNNNNNNNFRDLWTVPSKLNKSFSTKIMQQKVT